MLTRGIHFILLCLIFGLAITCQKSDPTPEFTISNTGPYILVPDHLQTVKKNLDDPFLSREYEILLVGADRLLSRTFQFVTDKPGAPPSGDPNDYMSVTRYTPGSDRNFNPQIEQFDRPKLALFSSAVYTLALAYYFSGNGDYAERASELVRAWFFDEETRMNPNMNYAQVNFDTERQEGEWQGIIDANDLVPVIEAVSILYDSHHWSSDDHIKLKEWFYDFSMWYVRRYNANASCSSDSWCNNVSTWMDVQRASFFLFTEQEHLLNRTSHIMPINEKISKQFRSDGVQPFEKNRSREQHYFYFNLRGMVELSSIRKNRGNNDRDWPALNTPEHGGLQPAFRAIIAHLSGKAKPNHFSAEPDFDDCRYLEILRPAALVFESQEYDEAAAMLIEKGCSNPDITLVYPPKHLLHTENPGNTGIE